MEILELIRRNKKLVSYVVIGGVVYLLFAGLPAAVFTAMLKTVGVGLSMAAGMAVMSVIQKGAGDLIEESVEFLVKKVKG